MSAQLNSKKEPRKSFHNCSPPHSSLLKEGVPSLPFSRSKLSQCCPIMSSLGRWNIFAVARPGRLSSSVLTGPRCFHPSVGAACIIARNREEVKGGGEQRA